MKRRPRLPALYNYVQDYNSGGNVRYVAHLIDRAGNATRLGDEKTGNGGIPANHPDQVYWSDNGARINAAFGNVQGGGISRIEIDCTLMPCDGQFTGCLFRVPHKIRDLINQLRAQNGNHVNANFITDNLPLRIFSHRPENAPSQVIFCTLGDTNDQLITAMANKEEWMWVEHRNRYLGPDIRVGNRTFRHSPQL